MNVSDTDRTFHGAFRRVAAGMPDAPALLFETDRLRAMTYRQLDEYSDRIAGRLARDGVGRGDLVPLLLERGFDCVACGLGVMKVGAVMVPLSSETPPDRAAAIVRDCRAEVALAHASLAGAVPAGVRTLAPDRIDWRAESPLSAREGEGGGLAYVMYTSGTTGAPKGVMIGHDNLLAFCRMYIADTASAAGARTIAHADTSFDAFIMAGYAPLLAGCRVYVLDAGTRLSLPRLDAYCRRHKMEIVFLTSRLAAEFMAAHGDCPIRLLIFGGEEAGRLRPVRYERINFYGPTEATVYVTAHRVLPSETEDIPIGIASGDNAVYLLDENGEPVADGEKGEICLAGPQVSPGYLGDPDLTARKFVLNPAYDSSRQAACFRRMYRSGDYGIRRSDGEILYRGRLDRQVKIRGYRIEIGEIEAALACLPGVGSVRVTTPPDVSGEPLVVAYYTSADGTALSEAELRDGLARRLPAYMLPRAFVWLAAMPLKTNGKIDESALPIPTSEY